MACFLQRQFDGVIVAWCCISTTHEPERLDPQPTYRDADRLVRWCSGGVEASGRLDNGAWRAPMPCSISLARLSFGILLGQSPTGSRASITITGGLDVANETNTGAALVAAVLAGVRRPRRNRFRTLPRAAAAE